MAGLELILLLLAVSAALRILADRLAVPYSALLVVGGLSRESPVGHEPGRPVFVNGVSQRLAPVLEWCAVTKSSRLVANGVFMSAEWSANIRQCSRVSAPPLLVILGDGHYADPGIP